MKITREQKKGIIGTVIVHLAVIFMLFLLVLRTPLPLPGEEGVEIRMGNSDEGAFSENIGAISASAPVASPQSLDEDEVVTQSEEETVAIETKPIRNPQQEQPETKSNPEPKPDPEPVVDPRAMYTGSSASSPGGGTGNSGDFGRRFKALRGRRARRTVVYHAL